MKIFPAILMTLAGTASAAEEFRAEAILGGGMFYTGNKVVFTQEKGKDMKIVATLDAVGEGRMVINE